MADTFLSKLKDGKLLPILDSSGNCTIDDRTLDANSSSSSASAGTGSGSNGSSVSGCENKLFVGGLSGQTTAKKLRDYFSRFGSVTDVEIVRDTKTQRSRGFGFITFNDATTVPKVLGVPVHVVDEKQIDPKRASPRSKSWSNKTKRLFVGGVQQEISVEDVKGYFSQFGKVEEAVMLKDRQTKDQTKRHRGYGFVTFDSEDVVDRICEIHFHTIKENTVECKKAHQRTVPLADTLVANLNLLAQQAVFPIMADQRLYALHQRIVASLAGVQITPAIAAAAANYSKLLGAGLHYRYEPYPRRSLNVAKQSNAMQHGAYTFPTVDMSGFQNFDWSGFNNASV